MTAQDLSICDILGGHRPARQRIEYDFAVTMGCGDACPHVRAKHRDDWNIPDPKNLSDDEFRAIRDLIEKNVRSIAADSLHSSQ